MMGFVWMCRCRAVLVFALALLVAGCGTARLDTDDAFIALVARDMPGFALTSDITGRAVRASGSYSWAVAQIRKTPREKAVLIASSFESRGLRPVSLVFNQPVRGGRTYWQMRFPGCVRGGCAAAAQTAALSQVSQTTYSNFKAFNTPHRDQRLTLREDTIGGVDYRARLSVSYASDGTVLEYSISFERRGITPQELRRLANAKGGVRDDYRVTIARYHAIVPLGLAAGPGTFGALWYLD